MTPIMWLPGFVSFSVALVFGWKTGLGAGIVVWCVLVAVGVFR